MRPQRGHQAHPAGQQRRARLGQLRVPRVERRRHRFTGRAAQVPLGPRGLEQGGALPQHPFVVRAQPRVPRRGGDQQLVQEPPPLAGIALDQGHVFGREQHRAQRAQDVPRPRHRRPVQPDPVGPAGVELDLHQRAALGSAHRGPQHGPVSAPPDQRRVGGDPVAAQRGQVADRLDQVGLAFPVRPAERGHARPELEAELGVGPEVGQREPGEVHRPSLRCDAANADHAAREGPTGPSGRAILRREPQRGAERSGGFRGVVPPGQHRPPGPALTGLRPSPSRRDRS